MKIGSGTIVATIGWETVVTVKREGGQTGKANFLNHPRKAPRSANVKTVSPKPRGNERVPQVIIYRMKSIIDYRR